MKKLFPKMMDRPEGPIVAVGFLYGLAAFVAVPYILFWLVWGMNDDRTAMTTMEIIYHVINFAVVLMIFRMYLKDAFLNLQVDTKNCLVTAAIGAVLMGVWSTVVFQAGIRNGSDMAALAAFSTLPLPEMELQVLASDQIYYSPVLGTLCLVVLVPVTVSCLYYAVGFAPMAEKRPWMGYVVMALVAAIPRIVNALTFWAVSDELVLYLSQLPVHLIACWTYQKTDTVWTPILTLAVANLFACAGMFLPFGVA